MYHLKLIILNILSSLVTVLSIIQFSLLNCTNMENSQKPIWTGSLKRLVKEYVWATSFFLLTWKQESSNPLSSYSRIHQPFIIEDIMRWASAPSGSPDIICMAKCHRSVWSSRSWRSPGVEESLQGLILHQVWEIACWIQLNSCVVLQSTTKILGVLWPFIFRFQFENSMWKLSTNVYFTSYPEDTHLK